MKVASSGELGRLRATPAPRIKAGRLDDDNDDDEYGTQNRKDVCVFSMSFYLNYFVIALQKPSLFLSLSRSHTYSLTHSLTHSLTLCYYSWEFNQAKHDYLERAAENKIYERLRERLSKQM